MGSIASAPVKERLDRLAADQSGADQPGIAEKRALIDRIAASEQFRRSNRLRDFLLYVGGQSLKDGCPEIHEQEIGVKVFERSPDYDRSQDNIVRVAATDLRKRIALYFASEGTDEKLVLEIPRGAYKPIFHTRVPEAQSAAATPPDKTIRPFPLPSREARFELRDDRNRLNHIHIAWAIVCAALIAVCALLFQQTRAMRQTLKPWQDKPAVAAFWGAFLGYHNQTDIVLPDDSLMLTEDLVHHPISLEDYLNRNYMRQIQSSDLSTDRKFDLDQVFAHNLITFGGVRAAQLMLALIPASSPSNLTLARYYVADSFKRDSVILIGGKKANPWVHLFEDQMNFVTDFDDARSLAFVANRNPKPGELSIYPVDHDPNALVGYTTVAYLPNPSGTGNVIILAGTDSDATSSAAEFLTSEEDLEKFRDSLHVKNFPYFEVLLKTSRLSGTSFSSDILAYRTYPGLK